jgi:hypothetical protein
MDFKTRILQQLDAKTLSEVTSEIRKYNPYFRMEYFLRHVTISEVMKGNAYTPLVVWLIQAGMKLRVGVEGEYHTDWFFRYKVEDCIDIDYSCNDVDPRPTLCYDDKLSIDPSVTRFLTISYTHGTDPYLIINKIRNEWGSIVDCALIHGTVRLSPKLISCQSLLMIQARLASMRSHTLITLSNPYYSPQLLRNVYSTIAWVDDSSPAEQVRMLETSGISRHMLVSHLQGVMSNAMVSLEQMKYFRSWYHLWNLVKMEAFRMEAFNDNTVVISNGKLTSSIHWINKDIMDSDYAAIVLSPLPHTVVIYDDSMREHLRDMRTKGQMSKDITFSIKRSRNILEHMRCNTEETKITRTILDPKSVDIDISLPISMIVSNPHSFVSAFHIWDVYFNPTDYDIYPIQATSLRRSYSCMRSSERVIMGLLHSSQ